MVNHLRTLLLNGPQVADAPGEQYVPAYRPLSLPSYLNDIRARLFGATPDRTMLNYRLAQYMTLLHATELKKFVIDLDPRITYTAETGASYADLFSPSTFTPAAAGPSELTFSGSPLAPDASGLTRFNYDLTANKLTQWLPAHRDFEISLTPGSTPTTSLPVTLPDCGYQVAAFLPVTENDLWRITVYNRPQWSLGQIETWLRVAGEPVLLSLFGASLVEPYKTFANLFRSHPEMAYALGGLILAVAYRTEEIRKKGE